MTHAKQILTDRATMRVTINDMADALGLTKSTVSRALNGYVDISEATQLRVKRMAEKLNYQPLSHAQAIKTGRTRSIGLVLQMSDHDAHRPFLTEFLSGVSSGASAEGYTLTVASADDEDHMIATFQQLLRDRKADGFILPRAMVKDKRVEMLREANVPFILFGRQDDDEGCCWHDIRGEDAMNDAVLYLAKLGHRRIGFINGGLIYNYAGLRRVGFNTGMAAANLKVDPDLIIEDVVTVDKGAEAGLELLQKPNRPTAIVCAVDHAALGVYRAAQILGLEIGVDLSVIGYDGIQQGANVQPQLSTFAVDTQASGQRLAALLVRRIRGETVEKLRETVPAIFLDRGSIGRNITTLN